MTWIRNLISKISVYFRGQAAVDAERALSMVVYALPVITIAADIVAMVTPTGIDDAFLSLLKGKFPKLFDGSIKSPDELKLYALGVATELLKARYPSVSTTVARAATQLAYLQYKSDKESI